MKNKFERMSKKERKEIVKEYRSISEGKDAYIATLNRMLVIGIIGFIYGLLAILVDIFVLNVSFWTYIIDAIVMIFTVFLMVQRNRIFSATMNNYVINKDKEENKKSEKKSTKKESKKDKKTKEVDTKEEKKVTTKKSSKKEEKEEVEMPKKKETKKATTKTAAKKNTSKTKKTTTKKTSKKA